MSNSSYKTGRDGKRLRCDPGRRVALSPYPLAAPLVILFCVFLTGLSLHAQQSKPSEYKVKAAYLYNFGRFVNWPGKTTPEQDGIFAVCVLGPDPFGAVLDSTLAGVSLDGKPVVIKRISKPQDATACRILYINPSEEGHLREILAAIDQMGVLTVSD